tara:strand:- start:305 stop:496 length:192 start_codon:yes stop_codon:yes gene_type:complete
MAGSKRVKTSSSFFVHCLPFLKPFMLRQKISFEPIGSTHGYTVSISILGSTHGFTVSILESEG